MNHRFEMKVRNLHILLVLMLLAGAVLGQNQENLQKVETAKIGFITQRINLTTAQATTFWPLYNDYSTKKKEYRSALKDLRKETGNLSTTDDKILANIKETFALRRREIDLEAEFFEKFKKVLSARQLAELYKAEQEFTRMLLSKLEGGER